MLKIRIARAAQRVAEGERYEEGAGRLGLLGVLAHHADGGGGDALGFERAGQHTSGVRAEGAGRRDQGHVDALVAEAAADLRPGLLLDALQVPLRAHERVVMRSRDRKSTRLNSSHSQISYAVFCLKKKKKKLITKNHNNKTYIR